MPDKKSKHREERKRKRSRSREEHTNEKEEKRGRNEKREKEEKDNAGGLGQERLSMSIDETNKVRAKLGLKPLQIDSRKEGDVKKEGEKKENEDVHQPAINMGDKKKTNELKEKLAQMKEKRRNDLIFSKIKPLACDDDRDDGDVESVISWVDKSRKIELKKKKFDEGEKLSKEFGIDKIMKKEVGVKESNKYSSKDLKGMKIEHDSERFKEGKDTILTLKDKAVLDEKDDVLVNVNMVDDEAAEQNVENLKKKVDYNPYEDLEYDEHGKLREDTILSKYDDEIRGGKIKKNFVIGDVAARDEDAHSSNKMMQSLMLPKPVLVSEYYTPQEIELSGKPRNIKAKKIRKKAKLKADDLLDIQKSNEGTSSKAQTSLKHEMKAEVKEEVNEDWDPYANLSGVMVEEDGAQLELELAIKKASRINATKKEEAVTVKEEPEDLEEPVEVMDDDYKAGIVLNSTAEYCRQLGEVAVVSEPHASNLMNEEEGAEDDSQDKTDDATKGWQSVDMEEGEVAVKEEDTHVLDEEPILNKGVGAALMLASKKGYLNSKNSKQSSARMNSNLEAKNYSIEDKRVEDDDKYRNKRDRYSNSGPIVPFREKDGYDPDIKLEYIDDLGREMSKKEAFRYLSHQFHGKGSGLKKSEKRMKKEKDDVMNRTTGSSETPLTTVQMLVEKQKHSKLPYVILGNSKAKN